MEMQLILSNKEDIHEFQAWIEESQLDNVETKLGLSIDDGLQSNKGLGVDPNSVVEIFVAIGGTAAAAAFVNGMFNTIKAYLEYKSKNREIDAKDREIESKENEITLKKGDYEISFNMKNLDKIKDLQQSFLTKIEPEIKNIDVKKEEE